MSECLRVKGQSFYSTFTFRDVEYQATGRFGYVKGSVLVNEAVGPQGEITWSDSDGNFYVCPANETYPASTATIHNAFTVPIPIA